MRVGYARVSTGFSFQDSSIERQIETFKSRGCDLVLVERESGTSDNRNEYQRLLSMIQLGEVTCVVACRSDRLNRNQLEQNYFYALCCRHGVEWEFTDEPEASSKSPFTKERYTGITIVGKG